MATKIRGITIELGADTSGLEKALKDTNKSIKTTENELKDVEKLLKLDPKNTELLAQKQKLLGQQISQTRDKLETLRKAEKEAEEQFRAGKIGEEQYRAIKREVAATENAVESLGNQAKQTNAKLAKVPETFKDIGKAAKDVASKTRGISLAAGGILTALGANVLSAAASADDINTLSKRSGISTDRIQEYRYAAELLDVSADSIIQAQRKLKQNMTSTSANVVSAFNRLGVSVADANGELRDSSEVFDEVVAGLGKLKNETERDTLAMTIFGKGADELAGIVDDGGEAFRVLAKEAREAGAVLSQDSLNALNKTNDALDRLKAKGTAALGQVAEKLVNNPKFEAFLEKTTDLLDGLVESVADMPVERLEKIVAVLAGTAAVSPLASLIGNVAGAVGKVSTALGGLKGAGGLASAIGGSGGLTSALGAVASAAGPIAAIAASVAVIAGFVAILAEQDAKVKTLNETKDSRLATEVYGSDLAQKIGRESGGWVDTVETIRQGEKMGVLSHAEAVAAYEKYDAGDISAAQAIVAGAAPTRFEAWEEKQRAAFLDSLEAPKIPKVDIGITFNGSLAGLGEVLAPEVSAAINRSGENLTGTKKYVPTQIGPK